MAETVSLLKNKTSSLHEWHAYSSILTALTPSAESESWEFTQVLKRLDLSSDKALLAAAARKSSLIETDSDAEELWFAQEKRKYKNSFAEKQSKHIPTIENFWITNTQASPGIETSRRGSTTSSAASATPGLRTRVVAASTRRASPVFARHA